MMITGLPNACTVWSGIDSEPPFTLHLMYSNYGRAAQQEEDLQASGTGAEELDKSDCDVNTVKRQDVAERRQRRRRTWQQTLAPLCQESHLAVQAQGSECECNMQLPQWRPAEQRNRKRTCRRAHPGQRSWTSLGAT